MEKGCLIVLSLFFVIFLVPSISAEEESSKRIIYVIAGKGLEMETLDLMVENADPDSLDNFLKAKGFSKGKKDPSFQSLLSGGKASPLMEEYIRAYHTLGMKQLTGVDPDIEIRKMDNEGISYRDTTPKLRGVKLDPGKDFVIFIEEGDPMLRGTSAMPNDEGV